MAVAIQSLSCARFVTFGGNRSFPLQPKSLPFSITLSSPSRYIIVTASSKNKNKNKKKKSSHFTTSSKNKNNNTNNNTTTNNSNNKEKTPHVTKENDKEEDALEMLFKKLEKVLKTDDFSKDDSGDDHVTEEDVALFERELNSVLGELGGVLGGFDSELLNSDTGETQADNDAEKNSGDRNENSLFRRELDGMLGEFEGALDEFDAVNSDTNETQVVNDAKKSSSDGNENSPKLRISKLNKLVRALKTRRRKTSKNLSHVTEGNDEKEDAFEMLFKKLEEALKNDDLPKDDSGDDDITEEEIALFEQKLEGVLGDFSAELLNSDSSETHADNDAVKNSGDGYENSKLRTLLSSISFSLFGECI
ncbi:unnamed protein product [Trifolium pratense]|uniref:Uncharacterized protein n=1 Tax=Trifolium pratense TaxID=57577 RepID=A0ACB0JGX9_TRIPR|nr:unnamed protein product [Trifolium pratense]